jgi:hypothetical protein
LWNANHVAVARVIDGMSTDKRIRSEGDDFWRSKSRVRPEMQTIPAKMGSTFTRSFPRTVAEESPT